MARSPAAQTTRKHNPITGPLSQHSDWAGKLQDGDTDSGRVLGTERQPGGALVLCHGHAVVEMVKPAGPPEEVRGPFDFGQLVSTSVDEPAVAARYRIGPGDHLEIAGGGRHPEAAVARVHAHSVCEWTFVPVDPGTPTPGPDEDGRHPLLGALADRRFLHRQDLVTLLTRFPLLQGLSYDAVRYVASFFRIGRYVPGTPVVRMGDKARPMLILAGRVEGPHGLLGPGSTIFPDDLTWDDAAPVTPAPGDYVARSRTLVAWLPTKLGPALAAHDRRTRRRHTAPHPWPWVVMLADPDEIPPDGQTLAFNQAARAGVELHPTGLDPQIPVLVVDADFASLQARACASLLSKVVHSPEWSTWTGPPPAFGQTVAAGVAALDFGAYGTASAVEKLVERIDTWMSKQKTWRKVLFRLPRGAPDHWQPLIQRADKLMVTVDDLLQPLPPLVPPLADVLRLLRPDPEGPGRVVSRMPFFTFLRDEGPTRDFWRTGVPWVHSQE